MKKNDGGPAFPAKQKVNAHSLEGTLFEIHAGMTMRQWYKGHAINAAVRLQMMVIKSGSTINVNADQVGQLCADIADVMIAEDEEGQNG